MKRFTLTLECDTDTGESWLRETVGFLFTLFGLRVVELRREPQDSLLQANAATR